MKTVLVIGSFDIPHLGHFEFLEQCAELGRVVVALGTDPFQTKYKRKPILTYWQRKATLEILPWVDEVVKRDKSNTRDIFARVDPDYLPYGSDWTEADYLAINYLTSDYLAVNDITLVRIVNHNKLSTTEIIMRCVVSNVILYP